ncbi:MAG: hypothetical protein K8R23_00820 [Chthoniobacter sp.]|nr:hypothetical protein [Chthoniobacter sp.]
MLIVLGARNRVKGHVVIIALSSVAIFGVVLPAPGILNGEWADGLNLWYRFAAIIAGAFWGWESWQTKGQAHMKQPDAISGGAPTQRV